MSEWMSDKQKHDLLAILGTHEGHSAAAKETVLMTRLQLETTDAELRAAAAEEKAAAAQQTAAAALTRAADAMAENARYVLWSVIAAAVAAIAALASTAIAVFAHL